MNSIVIISGSHRKNSQSTRVAQYLKNRLESLEPKSSSSIICLGESKLPLWDESFWKERSAWDSLWNPIAAQLSKASAFILISPEYAGMSSPALRNFFLFCNQGELSHKAALLVSVSSGESGSYPIGDLRLGSSKNNKICYIPEHLIIRHVENALHLERTEADNTRETYLRERIDFTLTLLLHYSDALSKMRKQFPLDFKKYPNGL